MGKISSLSSVAIVAATVGGLGLAVWSLPSVPRSLTQPQKFSQPQFSDLNQASLEAFPKRRLWFRVQSRNKKAIDHTNRFQVMAIDAKGWDVLSPQSGVVYRVTPDGKWAQGQWQTVTFEVGEPLLRRELTLPVEQMAYTKLLAQFETALNDAPEPWSVPESHSWVVSDFRVSGQLKGQFTNAMSSPAVHLTKDGVLLRYATICDLRTLRGHIEEGTLRILAPIDISLPEENLGLT